VTTDTRTGSSLFNVLADPNDQSAWERFVYRHQARIRKWCRLWGSQEADAEDISQMILCKLLEQLKAFRYDPRRGTFRAWLKTVTRNTWLNLRRQPRPIHLDDAAWAEWEKLHEETCERELFQEALARIQTQVEIDTWRVFELYVLEGRSPADVSRQTGKSVPAIYMVRYRVARKLADEIAKLDTWGAENGNSRNGA
jgi:RNA polymerase sigma-70 factor (ECF subfamily)